MCISPERHGDEGNMYKQDRSNTMFRLSRYLPTKAVGQRALATRLVLLDRKVLCTLGHSVPSAFF
jgi:hypothetical protein